jgi:hypothetical protein
MMTVPLKTRNHLLTCPIIGTRMRRGHTLTKGGPQRLDTSGMTQARADLEIELWRKAPKKYTDALAATKTKLRNSLEYNDNDHDNDGIEFLGVATHVWRLMSAVEEAPMCVRHNYQKKAILLLRIAEEANLHNLEITTIWSCGRRVYVDGRNGAKFKVCA